MYPNRPSQKAIRNRLDVEANEDPSESLRPRIISSPFPRRAGDLRRKAVSRICVRKTTIEDPSVVFLPTGRVFGVSAQRRANRALPTGVNRALTKLLDSPRIGSPLDDLARQARPARRASQTSLARAILAGFLGFADERKTGRWETGRKK